jgi:hypothetical protein
MNHQLRGSLVPRLGERLRGRYLALAGGNSLPSVVTVNILACGGSCAFGRAGSSPALRTVDLRRRAPVWPVCTPCPRRLPGYPWVPGRAGVRSAPLMPTVGGTEGRRTMASMRERNGRWQVRWQRDGRPGP